LPLPRPPLAAGSGQGKEMFVTPGYAQEAAPSEAEGQDAHGAADAHSEVAPDAHASGGFPPFEPTYFPSQILWLAITFGLFYLFLKKVVLPRIGGVLEVRRDRIAQDLDQAARMKAEADAAVAAYEQELAEARTSAGVIGQQARDAARADADAERKRIEADLDAKLAESEQRIASIKAKALGEVGAIAEETAEAIVQQLFGGKVDRAAIAAAVSAAKE
jgi:F-type H+-transporting ATPase subunit b